MAQRRGLPFSGLSGRLRRESAGNSELLRLEEKRQSLIQATEQWLSLLRDMERTGESSSGQYEHYFQAYVEAKQLEKKADLELFNLRSGLVDRR